MSLRTCLTALIATAAALALPGQGAANKPVVCPVTRLSVPAKAAVAKESYKGKTYYFCTMNCKRVFDKNRAKYAK